MTDNNPSNNIKQSASCPHFTSTEQRRRPKLSVKNVPKWKPQDVIRYLEHERVFPRNSSTLPAKISTTSMFTNDHHTSDDHMPESEHDTEDHHHHQEHHIHPPSHHQEHAEEEEYDREAIQEFKSSIISHRIGGMQFLHLDKDDLVALGATSFHLRLSILFHIDKLRKIHDALQSKYIAKHAAKEAIAEYISIIDEEQQQQTGINPENIVDIDESDQQHQRENRNHHNNSFWPTIASSTSTSVRNRWRDDHQHQHQHRHHHHLFNFNLHRQHHRSNDATDHRLETNRNHPDVHFEGEQDHQSGDNNTHHRNNNTRDKNRNGGGILAKVKSVTFSASSRNQSMDDVEMRKQDKDQTTLSVHGDDEPKSTVVLPDDDHNQDHDEYYHHDGEREREELHGDEGMTITAQEERDGDDGDDGDGNGGTNYGALDRRGSVEGEQSRPSIETTLSSLDYEDNSAEQREKTRITAKRIWKNMLRARHADTLAPVPNMVQLATIWVSISALLQAVADLVLEALILVEALPKLPLRLAFLCLTALSALLAYDTLKGVKRRKLDVTVAAIRVSFFIELSLVVTDLVFILDRDEGVFPAAYLRIPFICLTGINILLIVFTSLKLHLIPGIKNWCLE